MGKKSTSASSCSRAIVGFFFPCYLETIVLTEILLEFLPVKNVKKNPVKGKNIYVRNVYLNNTKKGSEREWGQGGGGTGKRQEEDGEGSHVHILEF